MMDEFSRKFSEHMSDVFGRQIAVLEHAGHHVEERFIKRFAGGRELLSNFFAIFLLFDELLHTAQLPLHAGEALHHLAFFIGISQLAHGLNSIPLGVYNISDRLKGKL